MQQHCVSIVEIPLERNTLTCSPIPCQIVVSRAVERSFSNLSRKCDNPVASGVSILTSRSFLGDKLYIVFRQSSVFIY